MSSFSWLNLKGLKAESLIPLPWCRRRKGWLGGSRKEVCSNVSLAFHIPGGEEKRRWHESPLGQT